MFNNRWFSIVVGSGLAVLLLVSFLTVLPAFAQGGGMDNNGGMMGNGGSFGPGWMMDSTQGLNSTNQFGFGPGMMGGGMMVNPNNPFYIAPQPLTLDEANTTLDAYLADLNDSNLTYVDVMVFDNHAYAQIVEIDSGIGVMEVLIDSTTQVVYPEMGPNMMWNQKYGMMSGFGRYGMMSGMTSMMGGANNGMMGDTFNFGTTDSSAELTVTPTQAVEAAQSYLDTNFATASLTADEHADPFYGYYTVHVNQAGESVGMLSVNGYTGAVWPHTWHGQLLAMGEE